jgi:uncharacterized LabA/DUF88 family protein
MIPNRPLPSYDLLTPAKAMIFVDGENLTMRYKAMIEKGQPTMPHVKHEPDVFVWTDYANLKNHRKCQVVRRHYYTCSAGDDDKIEALTRRLKYVGIEAPFVFKKEKGRKSKQVDISLATDMLTHAFRKNYDIAILVAGDEDYIPLVKAVMSEGRRVVLWFVEDGLSPKLVNAVDHYFDFGRVLFGDGNILGMLMHKGNALDLEVA